METQQEYAVLRGSVGVIWAECSLVGYLQFTCSFDAVICHIMLVVCSCVIVSFLTEAPPMMRCVTSTSCTTWTTAVVCLTWTAEMTAVVSYSETSLLRPIFPSQLVQTIWCPWSMSQPLIKVLSKNRRLKILHCEWAVWLKYYTIGWMHYFYV